MVGRADILKSKYPAKEHAKRVIDYVKGKGAADGTIYLEGQKTRMIEDNDGEAPFRQRRYFYYLTGCNLPDCSLAYDIDADRLTLFIPPVDQESVIWSGLPLSLQQAKELYDVDEVLHTTDVNSFFASRKGTIHAIQGQVSEGIPSLASARLHLSLIKEAIEECRVFKDSFEVELIRHANDVTTLGHTRALQSVRSASNERELYALFLQTCISNGCPEQAYHGIFASGINAATLHYVKNDEDLTGRQNMLLDAACESHCYAADVTRTFPINGKFTPESRSIYDLVLKMQLECIEMLKEGVLWDGVHAHAHKVAIRGLLDLGILQNGTVQEIFDARTSVAFFPHGLGHYLGMDTHDTGGHADYADKDLMYRYLRVRGTLPAQSVITVEPGIYFCRFIVEPYLKDKAHANYINNEILEKYWDVGGVRIEDNILITHDGYENLTTAIKDADEMEKIISS